MFSVRGWAKFSSSGIFFFLAKFKWFEFFFRFLFWTMLKTQYSYYCFKANRSWQQQQQHCVPSCRSFVACVISVVLLLGLGNRHYYLSHSFLFIIWSWKYGIFSIILIFFLMFLRKNDKNDMIQNIVIIIKKKVGWLVKKLSPGRGPEKNNFLKMV